MDLAHIWEVKQKLCRTFQEADREMRELMAWMRQEREDEGAGGGEVDAEGNEEEADPDLLLALAEQAEQAASQRTPGLMPAPQVGFPAPQNLENVNTNCPCLMRLQEMDFRSQASSLCGAQGSL